LFGRHASAFLFSSRFSHARAVIRSRFTVVDDTSRTTAVSSIESQPPRLCIEDAQFAERGIQRARSTSAFPGDAISGIEREPSLSRSALCRQAVPHVIEQNDTYTQASTLAKRRAQTKVVGMIFPKQNQTTAVGGGN